MSGKELRKMARNMVRERRGKIFLVFLASSVPLLLYLAIYTVLTFCFQETMPEGVKPPVWASWIMSYFGSVLMFGFIKAISNLAAGGEKTFEGFFFYANRELIGKALLLALVLRVTSAALTAIPGMISQYGMTLAKPVGYEEIGLDTSLPIYGEDYTLGSSLISLGALLSLGVGILLIIFLFSVQYRFVFHPEDGVSVQLKESLKLGKENFGKIVAMHFWLLLPVAGFAIVWALFIGICLTASYVPALSIISSVILIIVFLLAFFLYAPYMEIARLLLAEDIMGLLPKKQKKAKRKKA